MSINRDEYDRLPVAEPVEDEGPIVGNESSADAPSSSDMPQAVTTTMLTADATPVVEGEGIEEGVERRGEYERVPVEQESQEEDVTAEYFGYEIMGYRDDSVDICAHFWGILCCCKMWIPCCILLALDHPIGRNPCGYPGCRACLRCPSYHQFVEMYSTNVRPPNGSFVV